MKNLAHLRLFAFCILFCCVIILSSFRFLGRLYPGELQASAVGVPIVVREVVQHNYLGINQIVSTTEKIYIMHAHHGVVSVYDNNGVYQYTISVYSHKNGRAEVAVHDGLLYVRDKQGNVYCFQEDTLLEFTPQSRAKDLESHIDFDTQSTEYFLKGASIHRQVSSEASECVISRPSWLFFTQTPIAQLLTILLMIACFVCLKLPARKS